MAKIVRVDPRLLEDPDGPTRSIHQFPDQFMKQMRQMERLLSRMATGSYRTPPEEKESL